MSFIIAVCLSCRGVQLAGGKFLAFQRRLVGVASILLRVCTVWMKGMGVLIVQACNIADLSLLKAQVGLLCCVVGLVCSVHVMPATPLLHTGSLDYMPSQAHCSLTARWAWLVFCSSLLCTASCIQLVLFCTTIVMPLQRLCCPGHAVRHVVTLLKWATLQCAGLMAVHSAASSFYLG
jgi:hypothetical protein